MIETVFTLLILGCTDPGGSCATVEQDVFGSAPRRICERQLDLRMARHAGAWPEIRGICFPGRDLSDAYAALGADPGPEQLLARLD